MQLSVGVLTEGRWNPEFNEMSNILGVVLLGLQVEIGLEMTCSRMQNIGVVTKSHWFKHDFPSTWKILQVKAIEGEVH